MKALSLFLFIIATALNISAQDTLDKISADCCACMEKDRASMEDPDKWQTALGLCMLGAAAPYEKELKKKYGVDMSQLDRGAGEKLGELLGVRLATNCPYFLELISSMEDDEDESSTLGMLTGSVKEVRTGQFITIVVQDEQGRTYEMLVLDHFENADRVTDGKAEGLNADWEYAEREYYDPNTRSYRSFKVVQSCTPIGK